MLLGVCGPSSTKPILFIDPTYTNYIEFCKRLIYSICYLVQGKLRMMVILQVININEISEIIDDCNPRGIVIIPGDNPTGQQISQELIFEIARLCIEKDLWLISDEAYRSLYYKESGLASIWALNDQELPGLSGRRISIESVSKIWNACGLRIGSLVTDNEFFMKK